MEQDKRKLKVNIGNKATVEGDREDIAWLLQNIEVVQPEVIQGELLPQPMQPVKESKTRENKTRDRQAYMRQWYAEKKARETKKGEGKKVTVSNHKFSAWTKEEDELVRKHYGKMKARLLAKQLHRTLVSVYTRARFLGVVMYAAKHRDNWTPAEDAVLREKHGSHTAKEMTQFLPQRTKKAIQVRSSVLGLGKWQHKDSPHATGKSKSMFAKAWSAEENARALSLYAKGTPVWDIAKQLGRAQAGVRLHLYKLRKAQGAVVARKGNRFR